MDPDGAVAAIPDADGQREALLALIAKHVQAEVAQDVAGVMATLRPSPRFEVHPLGYVLNSAEAVAEFYRRTLPLFDKFTPAGTSSTFGGEPNEGNFLGANEVITKDFLIYHGADGTRTTVKCLSLFLFDPASGLLEGEQMFLSDTGAGLIGAALGDDFTTFPGVETFGQVGGLPKPHTSGAQR